MTRVVNGHYATHFPVARIACWNNFGIHSLQNKQDVSEIHKFQVVTRYVTSSSRKCGDFSYNLLESMLSLVAMFTQILTF